MKIALASAKFINNDIAYNLHQMERYARCAKDSGSDLICLEKLSYRDLILFVGITKKTKKLLWKFPPRLSRKSADLAVISGLIFCLDL